MEVVLGKTAGFCGGVKRAIDKAKEIIKEKDRVYCLGEIVHNKQIINMLEEKGMITVNSIEEVPAGETVIFRAHGEAKKIYERAEEKKLEIIDTTCVNVQKIHLTIEEKKKDAFIIILGKKNHPETIGSKGFAGEFSFVIENEEDISSAYEEYKKTNLKKVFIIAQTTISSILYDELVEKIKLEFKNVEIENSKTICSATEIRQKETMEMAKKFHSMIIIGGKNSSNTKELVNISKKFCKNVYAIETSEEIKNIDFSGVENIGVMAGASTPKESIDEVLNLFMK